MANFALRKDSFGSRVGCGLEDLEGQGQWSYPKEGVMSALLRRQQWDGESKVAFRGMKEEILPSLGLVVVGKGACLLRQWTHTWGKENEFTL